jgi:hypothetical protein
MDERSIACVELMEEILHGGAYKATKFLGTDLTIKATRKRYDGKILRQHAIDVVFTIGKPNYEERAQIKRAKKAGQGPIEMTMKYPPKKK